MFFLVQFEDGVLYVCDERRISKIHDECTVKYRNGTKYPAKILSSCKDKNIVEDLRLKLVEEKNNSGNEVSCDTQEILNPETSLENLNVSNFDEYFSSNISNVSNVVNSSLFDENEEFVLMDLNDGTIKVSNDSSRINQKELAIDIEGLLRSSEDPSTDDSDKTKTNLGGASYIKPSCENSLSDQESGFEKNIGDIDELGEEIIITPTEDLTSDDITGANKTPNNTEERVEENTNLSGESFIEPFGDSGSEYLPSELGSIRNITAIEDVMKKSDELGEERHVTFTKDLNSEDISDLEEPVDITEENTNLSERSFIEPFEDSGSEYVPSELGSSRNSVSEEGNMENSDGVDASNAEIMNLSKNDSLVTRTSLEMEDMIVGPSTKETKKLHCMYCGKFLSKFARHLETVHKNEETVKEFLHLKPGCPDRKKIIDTIKKKSQFQYNTKSSINKGDLLVSRRSQERLKRSGKDYKVCYNCKGFFSKYNLRHHAKKCFNFRGNRDRNLTIMGRKILVTIHPEASDKLRNEIFPVLKEDNVVRIIRQDRLVILYGNKMCRKYRLQHQNDLIRSHLRMIGRFLLSVKSIRPEIKDMASLYDPAYYDDCVAAINDIAGYDPDTNQFNAPSTAYNVGSIIKKIAELQIVDCIKQKSSDDKHNAEDFLKLLINDISVSVNKTVVESQAQNERRKTVILPTANDIKMLKDYLEKEVKISLNVLKKKFDFDNWMSLAEATLIAVQLFNRRRAGECERIFIEDYKSHAGIDTTSIDDLSPKSRKLAGNYIRFEIRGKLNRSVPVLLSIEHKEAIECLLELRKKAGVPDGNRFVFGIPGGHKGSFKYLRACILMREFSKECGAKLPATLRGTQLRKHVATNCINLDLSDNEVSDMAQFMGHSDKIQIRHYRQPIVRREILRISRLLEKAQGKDNSDDSEESSNETAVDSVPSSSKSADEGEASIGDSKRKRSTSPYGKVKQKKRWTKVETETAMGIFEENIRNHNYPSLKQIQKLQDKYPALKNRSAVVIKT